MALQDGVLRFAESALCLAGRLVRRTGFHFALP